MNLTYYDPETLARMFVNVATLVHCDNDDEALHAILQAGINNCGDDFIGYIHDACNAMI